MRNHPQGDAVKDERRPHQSRQRGWRNWVLALSLGTVVLGAGWWFQTPEGGRSGFSYFDAEEIHCQLVHDGLLYPKHEKRLVLLPGGDRFSGRVGPHEVMLRFVDQGGRHGLEHEYLTRSFGATSGSMEGTDERSVDTIAGFGIGTLTVSCASDKASSA